MARRTVQVRHLCYGWNHPQFAYALVTLASVLSAIGNEVQSFCTILYVQVLYVTKGILS
jgi:hypothetical protein